ncbi:unnamed protein product, partial [Rotaria socialis]
MTSLYNLTRTNEDDKNRPSKKRKSTHRRTARSISCDTNESS